MKRGICFLFLIILFSSLFISASVGDLEGIQDQLDDAENKIGTITDKDLRTDYLKQEWAKIAQNKPFIGPIMKFYDDQKIALIVDPIVKVLTGMDTSFSWVFFLGILLWVVGIVIVYQSIRYAGDYPAIWVIIVDFIFFGIVGFFGILERAAQFIVDTISLFTLWWVQLILIVLAVIIFGLMIYFSKYIKAFMFALKMRREAQEVNETKESLMTTIRNANRILKARNQIDKIA